MIILLILQTRNKRAPAPRPPSGAGRIFSFRGGPNRPKIHFLAETDVATSFRGRGKLVDHPKSAKNSRNGRSGQSTQDGRKKHETTQKTEKKQLVD